MRILHTADWHLGHTLRDHPRTAEHERFLQWLVEVLVEREVDALLIAGDVFDAANPPPSALRLWFRFLGDAKRARPDLQIVVIAGNHDSGSRLAAPKELLAAFGVHVVGAIERVADGSLRTDDLIVPLRAVDGRIAAVCVAIPFLRGSDVLALEPRTAGPSADDRLGVPSAPAESSGDPLLAGMRVLHDKLFAAARAVRQAGQALIALAHGYLVGGMLSELSERKVLGGNQHALPLDLFPPDCVYVALGHLHRPQQLGGVERIRYSGSPIPLSMPERLHAHHVVFVDLDGERLAKVWSLRVPRLVPLLRLPERGELEPDAALAAVAALPPRDPAQPDELRPFVEVAVRLDQPSPHIAERIARAIADRDARLVRVEIAAVGGKDEEPAGVLVELAALTPEEVFLRCWSKQHPGEMPAPLLAAFRQLLEQVEHGVQG